MQLANSNFEWFEMARSPHLIVAKLAIAVFWIVGLFYAYGAIVHIMNMLSMTGFNWLDAPLKWQILDAFYLLTDVIVAAGFFANWRIALPTFYLAATSQIFLYTLLRDWIIDVPPEFAVSPEQVGYLDTLVIFHFTTVVLVSFAWWCRNQKPAQAEDS